MHTCATYYNNYLGYIMKAKLRTVRGRPGVCENKLQKAFNLVKSGFPVSMAAYRTKLSTTTVYKFLASKVDGKSQPYTKRFIEHN